MQADLSLVITYSSPTWKCGHAAFVVLGKPIMISSCRWLSVLGVKGNRQVVALVPPYNPNPRGQKGREVKSGLYGLWTSNLY